MGKPVVLRVQRHEGGDDRDEFVIRHHRCPQAKRASIERGDPDIDAILYPVGLAGEGIPSGVVFEVMSAGACGACGALLKVWAEWVSPQVFL